MLPTSPRSSLDAEIHRFVWKKSPFSGSCWKKGWKCSNLIHVRPICYNESIFSQIVAIRVHFGVENSRRTSIWISQKIYWTPKWTRSAIFRPGIDFSCQIGRTWFKPIFPSKSIPLLELWTEVKTVGVILPRYNFSSTLSRPNLQRKCIVGTESQWIPKFPHALLNRFQYGVCHVTLIPKAYGS